MGNLLRHSRKRTSEKQQRQPKCYGGAGAGCKTILDENGDPGHRISYQGKYNDPLSGLKGIKLNREESKAAYFCRHCEEYQGCNLCIDDVASLVCSKCHDWANDVSERVHGRMIKDRDMKAHGMKLVMMVYDGEITYDEYTKMWNQARITQAKSENAQ